MELIKTKILIFISKDKRQLLKLVQYSKLIKSAKTKISFLNKELNSSMVIKGDTKEKFNFIQTKYSKQRKVNIDTLEEEFFGLIVKPYIHTEYSYFNMEKAFIKEDYLKIEYYKQIKENKHQVLQYNLLDKEPEGSKIFNQILNYVEKINNKK